MDTDEDLDRLACRVLIVRYFEELLEGDDSAHETSPQPKEEGLRALSPNACGCTNQKDDLQQKTELAR